MCSSDLKTVGTVDTKESSTRDLARLMVGRDLKDQFPKVSVEPGEEVLRVENLTRAGVLHGVNLHVRRGEVLGIAGLVGSKRTETARAIFGADPFDSGRILLRGQPIDVREPADAIRRGIALVPEDRKRQGILAVMSVRENITLSGLGRFSRGGLLDIASEKARAQTFVSSLRVATPHLDQWVLNLSGGNQQKVVIAKWLNTDAEVFLFDEPTRGIDVGGKVEVYKLMNELVARGAAIVMISSELPEILGMSDRILVMRDGHVAGEFLRGEATEQVILDCALRGGPARQGPSSGPLAASS